MKKLDPWLPRVIPARLPRVIPAALRLDTPARLLLFWLAFAAASALAQAPQPVATVEGVAEYRLANGLRVLTVPDPSADTVTVHMTYLVGSRHEGYGEKGSPRGNWPKRY